MTNTPITVFSGVISNQLTQLCNARQLHAMLESKYQYADWIKTRITDYGFIQNEDYLIVEEHTGGRPRREYHITLDMGKELAMVERNEQGRAIRKYFIECEKRAQNRPQIAPLAKPEPTFECQLTNPEMMDLAWLWYQNRKALEFIQQLTPALDALGSPHAGRAHSISAEYGRHLNKTGSLIWKLTKEADFTFSEAPKRSLSDFAPKLPAAPKQPVAPKRYGCRDF